MYYYGYHFLGMHLFWWFFWVIFIVIVMGLFEPVPRRKAKVETPHDILQRRFASGEITKEELEEKTRTLKAHQAISTT